MDTVEDIRNTLKQCQERTNLDDKLSPSDLVRYKELLTKAKTVLGLMDGEFGWDAPSYDYLEKTLRNYANTLLSIAWDVEDGHPRDWEE